MTVVNYRHPASFFYDKTKLSNLVGKQRPTDNKIRSKKQSILIRLI